MLNISGSRKYNIHLKQTNNWKKYMKKKIWKYYSVYLFYKKIVRFLLSAAFLLVYKIERIASDYLNGIMWNYNKSLLIVLSIIKNLVLGFLLGSSKFNKKFNRFLH